MGDPRGAVADFVVVRFLRAFVSLFLVNEIPAFVHLNIRRRNATERVHQLLAALLGAAIALAAHGGKTALRAAVTPSPEPVSNITLSLGEDILAVGLTWLATRHPYAAATIVAMLVAIILLLARIVIRALRALFRGAEQELTGRPA